MIKLWLDDMKEAPEGWAWAKTRDQAIGVLERGDVEIASLDYDINWDPGESDDDDDFENTRTGMAVVHWLNKTGNWPKNGVAVHSTNLNGTLRMICGLGEHYRKDIND